MLKQRFKYIPTKNALMPYVPLKLMKDNLLVERAALVDSGAEINVLPYHLGIQLGFVWSDALANIRLGGGLSQTPAINIIVKGIVFNLEPIELFFAWAASDTRLILGQTNFFSLYRICFYQDQGYFEITNKSN